MKIVKFQGNLEVLFKTTKKCFNYLCMYYVGIHICVYAKVF